MPRSRRLHESPGVTAQQQLEVHSILWVGCVVLDQDPRGQRGLAIEVEPVLERRDQACLVLGSRDFLQQEPNGDLDPALVLADRVAAVAQVEVVIALHLQEQP